MLPDVDEIARRISLDFPKTEEEVKAEILQIKPDFDLRLLPYYEQSGALECMMVGGAKRYFRRAARNLFRVDKDMKLYYDKRYGDDKEPRYRFLSAYLPEFIKNPQPKIFDFEFSLNLATRSISPQEITRIWLPRPMECKYQEVLEVNNTGVESGDSLHSSLYFESRGLGKASVRYTFLSKGFVGGIEKSCGEGYDEKDLIEQLPHIAFSPEICRLAQQIKGGETNPMEIARRIFMWISENISWAVAREYSTIDDISAYVLQNRHGDCGQKTLLFMSLCRRCGIPCRWLSGFMLYPGQDNLHDWCEVFDISSGLWLPVDVSFGLQKWATCEALRWFYFGSIDPYRLVVNRGISAEFYPKKIFPRSETIDFQRGEVETESRNLYFDEFSYSYSAAEVG